MKWLTCEETLEIITQLIMDHQKEQKLKYIQPQLEINRIIEIDTFDKSILSVDH